jgi:hypothetical protein
MAERMKSIQKKEKMNAKSNFTHRILKYLRSFVREQRRRPAFAVLASLCCSFGLAAFSSASLQHFPSHATMSEPNFRDQSTHGANTQEDAELSGKTPDELAAYIFEHHHCNGCHTMGAGGKLGFNDRGKEVGKHFEGCISLLTSINVIAQVKPVNRTVEEKHKAARFQQFGCTTCHQIEPGKLGLTEYGKKLKSMHMACTDVEKILAK